MVTIGVFGGSFDPIHIEHIEIIKVAFNEFKIDKVIIVPAFNPPHKKFLNVSDKHRLNMINYAIENLKNVFVDTFEIDLKRIVYTYETLDFLNKKYPSENLKLIIGADSYNQLHTWKKSEYIARKYGLFVIKRKNINIDISSKFFKYSQFSTFEGKISSTQVRENIKKGIDVSCILNSKVYNYIKENELYK